MKNIFIMDNQIKADEDLSIIRSKSGLPVLRYNSFYLNSKYDPVREAKRLAEQYYKKNHAHILFGLGFSYLAKEIFEKMGESDFLLIIEPSVKLFKEFLAQGELGPLENHSRVFFIVGYNDQQIEEEIKYLVSNYTVQVEVIISPNYEKLYPQYVKKLKHMVIKNVKLSVVNIATIAVFSKRWQNNLLYNLYESWQSLSFEMFKNRFTCPVIIASSGPSLTKQLGYLKAVKEKQSALIIAAGSTINPLLNSDIKPHLVVSIDGSEANWAHFKNINYDDIPLFYSLVVHKDIPGQHRGFKVVFNTDDKALSNWVNNVVGKELGFVYGGPSVANFCFDIARAISTGPITFIGQDLAYTNNCTHAEGNTNFKGISEEDFRDRKRYITIKGYYGGEVISSYQFLSMKKVFEDMVVTFRKQGDERPVYNSTEGGAFIDGFVNLGFKEFINNYCNESYSAEFDEAFKPYKFNLEQKKRIITHLQDELKNLKEVIRIAQKAINILDGTSRETVVDKKILKKLDKLDEKLNECLKNNIIYYIFLQENLRVNYLYQEGQDETPMDQTKRILNKSEALYKGILESAQFTSNILDEILNNE